MKRYVWLFLMFLMSWSGLASALPFGYLSGAGSADPTTQISAAGHTPVALTDLTATDLAAVDVLWVTNGNNSAVPTAVLNNLTAIADFVFNGGVLSYHDRYVSGGNTNMADVLPGAAGTVFVRDFSNGADIDILNASTMVTNGLDNSSLDGGTSSSHGYVDATSLPAGAVAILNRGGAPDEVVDFYYQYGSGWVYYSTIPLDYYIAGSGPNPPRDNFANIYAVNEAGFQASLTNGVPVPEPAGIALLGLGLAGLALRRRKA